MDCPTGCSTTLPYWRRPPTSRNNTQKYVIFILSKVESKQIFSDQDLRTYLDFIDYCVYGKDGNFYIIPILNNEIN